MVAPNVAFKEYKNLQFIKPVYSQLKTECSNSLLRMVRSNSGHREKGEGKENEGNKCLEQRTSSPKYGTAT
jgi:hypothetical protein